MAYLSDGTGDWSLGQDAWKDPSLIQPNQYASGVNISTRGNLLGPRPPFRIFETAFDPKQTITTDYGYVRSVESVWASGKFQAMIPYKTSAGRFIITVISGLIFRTNIDERTTTLLSDKIFLNQYIPRINSAVALDTIVLFDFPSRPILINGNEVTVSSQTHLVNGSPAPQVPVSVLGAYNQNRLFIANAGVGFTAGDGVGNLATPEAPITFTELFTPSSPFFNQQFTLSTGNVLDAITAMGFIQQLDTSTGIGALFVATKHQVYSYQSQQPRDQWETQQFGGVFLANAGIAGPRAFINVNSDLIFLSGQGYIHAFSNARNDAKKWGNIPISREVNNYLVFNDPDLAQYAVLGYYNNRVFISANPYRVGALDRSQRPVSDYAHGGFVVLEIEALASLLSQGTPIWDGLWTGVNPMEIQTLDEMCFVMSKDGTSENGINALYVLGNDDDSDIVRGGHERDVRSIVYTKDFTYGQDLESNFTYKKENTFSIEPKDFVGQIKLKIERKPSQSNIWLLLTEWLHDAPGCTEQMPEDAILNGITPHQITPLVFGDGKESGCNPVTGDSYEGFTSMQYRLTIAGKSWRIKTIKSKVELLEVDEKQNLDLCRDLPPVKEGVQCLPDWTIPETILCR